MARFTDLRKAVESIGLAALVKRVVHEIFDDELFTWAAAMAYSWIFAVFPFLIFVLSLLPYVPGKITREAERPIASAVYLLPRDAANTLWNNIESVMHTKRRGLLSLGAIFTVFAASGGMSMTMGALDRCYDIEKRRRFYMQRLIAVSLTLGNAVLIVGVLVLLPIGTLVIHWMTHHENHYLSRTTLIVWEVTRYSLAAMLLSLALSLLYHFGPSVKQRFAVFTPGSLFTLLVWLGLSIGFRLYVDHFGRYDQTYGAVGGVAILLLFFYVDALVLLIGAEINSEIDFVMGVQRGSTDFTRAAPLFAQAEAEREEREATAG